MNENTCESCIDGYKKFYLSDGNGFVCESSCRAGTFPKVLDDGTSKCEACSGDCKECVEKPANCLSCKSKIFLRNECIDSCPLGYFSN